MTGHQQQGQPSSASPRELTFRGWRLALLVVAVVCEVLASHLNPERTTPDTPGARDGSEISVPTHRTSADGGNA